MHTMTETRNQSMDCAKLLASFFVVFIHIRFPGNTGNMVDYIGRFAVPMFFIISGYFNFQASADKIAKRLKHILLLYISAVIIHVSWGCIVTELNGGSTVATLIQSIPDPDEFSKWIVLQYDPFRGHLWYLNASIVTYLVYWIYIRFQGDRALNYTPLYFAGFCLFSIFFFAGVLPIVQELESPYSVLRTAWFTGLPMFIFGIFLKNYQDQIFGNFSLTTGKLLIGMIAGLLLAVQQAAAVGADMPFGTLIFLPSLILLLVSHPTIVSKPGFLQNLILKFGSWSTWIYILHLIMDDAYELFFYPYLAVALAAKEAWLRPVFVAALSLICAIVVDGILCLLRKLRTAK